jgi:hypothetical protein
MTKMLDVFGRAVWRVVVGVVVTVNAREGRNIRKGRQRQRDLVETLRQSAPMPEKDLGTIWGMRLVRGDDGQAGGVDNKAGTGSRGGQNAKQDRSRLSNAMSRNIDVVRDKSGGNSACILWLVQYL